MKRRIFAVLIIGFLIAVGYLATLSDPPIDNSLKLVDVDRYLNKEEMSKDIDSLLIIFEKVHPNPYRFTTKSQFDSNINSIKRELPDSLTTLEFWRLIDQIIVLYNDAHSKVVDRYVLSDYINKEKLFFPYTAKIKNNKILLTGTKDSDLGILEGTEIKMINGKTDQEIISDLLKHAIKETQYLKLLEVSDDFGFYLWKTYNWNSDFNIHYKHNDSTDLDSTTVRGVTWEDRSRLKRADTETLVFELMYNDIGFMKIADFEGNEKEVQDFYKQSFKRLKESNSSSLIIDFRGHDGGADSYGEQLAKYFSKEPYRKLSKAHWKITPEFKNAFDRKYVPKGIRWFKPIYLINEYSSMFYGAEPNDYLTVNYELKQPLPEKDRFNGNVYLITDHNTFSAGSIFAEMFKYYNMGKVVGQPTGNLPSFNGFALANFTLPNSNLTFKVSSVYNISNSEEEDLTLVEPDFYIDPTDDPIEFIVENLMQ